MTYTEPDYLPKYDLTLPFMVRLLPRVESLCSEFTGRFMPGSTALKPLESHQTRTDVTVNPSETLVAAKYKNSTLILASSVFYILILLLSTACITCFFSRDLKQVKCDYRETTTAPFHI